MEINSIQFPVVVLIVLILYFIFQKSRFQKYIVMLADLYFMYALSNLKGVLIAMVIVAGVWFCGGKIGKNIEAGSRKAAHRWLLAGIVFDMGILLYFKFFKFTLKNVEAALHTGTILAPVGLAYFSLSLLGYLLDIYHKKHKPEKNYLDLMNFALFFPALIQGPFGFYRRLSGQLKENHTFSWDRMVSGLQRILWGYFKKMVIADRIGILVMGILNDDQAAGFLLFMSIVYYSFQIYADFSGGIDVIMGISEIMGIELFENFNAPLISKSVTEFWQRWHMSLGEWMEKYIYYPIVLNRHMMKFSKKIRHKYLSRAFSAALASLVVFILVGIWHGTGWNYVVYGAYQAFWVSTAVLLRPVYQKMNEKAKTRKDDIGWSVFQILRTFVILVFGRYLTKSSSLSRAILLLKRTFSAPGIAPVFNGGILKYGLNLKNYYLMLLCIVLLIVVDVCHEHGFHFREHLMKANFAFRCAVYMIGIFSIVIFGIYGPGYDASTFIYAGY